MRGGWFSWQWRDRRTQETLQAWRRTCHRSDVGSEVSTVTFSPTVANSHPHPEGFQVAASPGLNPSVLNVDFFFSHGPQCF